MHFERSRMVSGMHGHSARSVEGYTSILEWERQPATLDGYECQPGIKGEVAV
jgi:hypothetical protein